MAISLVELLGVVVKAQKVPDNWYCEKRTVTRAQIPEVRAPNASPVDLPQTYVLYIINIKALLASRGAERL